MQTPTCDGKNGAQARSSAIHSATTRDDFVAHAAAIQGPDLIRHAFRQYRSLRWFIADWPRAAFGGGQRIMSCGYVLWRTV